jgi:hypothetical protein
MGGGDSMWRPEATAGDVALLRVPLAAFGPEVRIADPSRYAALPRPERGWELQNRFVGDYVLYGTGTTWGYYAENVDPRVFVHRVDGEGRTTVLPLPHGVDRIEVMGRDAVVVGTDGRDLHFSAVSLHGDAPRMGGRYTQPNASQGETRSHGFFYRAESDHEGVLGLPIRSGTQPGWHQLVNGSASVLFLRVEDLNFRRVGALGSRDGNVNDQCVVSCVDWYGNARPIFLRGRTFALLGYELVEGRADAEGDIEEIGRTHFYRDMDRRERAAN